MPTSSYELPYEGAKEMLLVEEIDSKEFLTGLFNAMYDELPALKPKKKMLALFWGLLVEMGKMFIFALLLTN